MSMKKCSFEEVRTSLMEHFFLGHLVVGTYTPILIATDLLSYFCFWLINLSLKISGYTSVFFSKDYYAFLDEDEESKKRRK